MSGGLRIDKWLWHARLVKTRSLAGRLCAEGQVGLGGVPISRPAQLVRPGDVVTLSHGGWQRQIEVLALGTRRGPAPEARQLYREIAPPTRLDGADPAWVSLFDGEDDADSEG